MIMSSTMDLSRNGQAKEGRHNETYKRRELMLRHLHCGCGRRAERNTGGKAAGCVSAQLHGPRQPALAARGSGASVSRNGSHRPPHGCGSRANAGVQSASSPRPIAWNESAIEGNAIGRIARRVDAIVHERALTLPPHGRTGPCPALWPPGPFNSFCLRLVQPVRFPRLPYVTNTLAAASPDAL